MDDPTDDILVHMYENILSIVSSLHFNYILITKRYTDYTIWLYHLVVSLHLYNPTRVWTMYIYQFLVIGFSYMQKYLQLQGLIKVYVGGLRFMPHNV